MDSDSSSSSEVYNYRDEDDKSSIVYESKSADNDEIRNSFIGSKENISLGGCRDRFIIDKIKPNIKSNIK